MKPLVINFDELFNNIVTKKDNTDTEFNLKLVEIKHNKSIPLNNQTIIE